MPKSGSDSITWVRDHFARIWPAHLAGFVRLLRQLRQSSGGDLDLVLVLAVIADRTPPEGWVSRLPASGRLTRGAERVWQEPINIQSVADFSGIPKETVRRKVATLVERGWVARDGNGHLSVTRQAGMDLKAGTEASIAYLAGLRGAMMR